MTCECCTASRETGGLHRMYDPACLHCGARLVMQLGGLLIGASEVKARRQAVLDDWERHGHSRQAMRELAKGTTLPIASDNDNTTLKEKKRK